MCRTWTFGLLVYSILCLRAVRHQVETAGELYIAANGLLTSDGKFGSPNGQIGGGGSGGSLLLIANAIVGTPASHGLLFIHL